MHEKHRINTYMYVYMHVCMQLLSAIVLHGIHECDPQIYVLQRIFELDLRVFNKMRIYFVPLRRLSVNNYRIDAFSAMRLYTSAFHSNIRFVCVPWPLPSRYPQTHRALLHRSVHRRLNPWRSYISSIGQRGLSDAWLAHIAFNSLARQRSSLIVGMSTTITRICRSKPEPSE